MRNLIVPFAFLTLGSCALMMAGPNAVNPASADIGGHPETSPIQHVIILYQENHSFDDVLGAVCEQRSTPCNGYTGPVTMADGITAPNGIQTDIVPEIKHDPDAQQKA